MAPERPRLGFKGKALISGRDPVKADLEGAEVQARSPCKDSRTGDMGGPIIRTYVHRGSGLQTRRAVPLPRIGQTDTREI